MVKVVVTSFEHFGEVFEAEFVPGGTRFWPQDMWYVPNVENHTMIFNAYEVKEAE